MVTRKVSSFRGRVRVQVRVRDKIHVENAAADAVWQGQGLRGCGIRLDCRSKFFQLHRGKLVWNRVRFRARV